MKNQTGGSDDSPQRVSFCDVFGCGPGAFQLLLVGAEVIIFTVPDASENYCHLRFAAIRQETFSWPQPELKDPSEGDIVDFYGP